MAELLEGVCSKVFIIDPADQFLSVHSDFFIPLSIRYIFPYWENKALKARMITITDAPDRFLPEQSIAMLKK